MMIDVSPRAVLLNFSTRLAGDFDYADKWARAAIGGATAAFTNGLYDGGFHNYATGVARCTAASKAFLSTWIYGIGIMSEEAINMCDTTANTAALLGFWDKGVAYCTGSFEGSDGNIKTSTYASTQSFKVGYSDYNPLAGPPPQQQQLTSYLARQTAGASESWRRAAPRQEREAAAVRGSAGASQLRVQATTPPAVERGGEVAAEVPRRRGR